MAGTLNKALLIGRLTRDPELRYTPSGTAVCNFSVATNRYSTGDDGQRREQTDYHDVVVWNQGNRKLAELCSQYLQKGRMVYVEGRIQTRSWDDAQTGQKRYRTEINAQDVQFLDSQRDGGGAASGNGTARTSAPASVPTPGAPERDIDPDDIPF